MRLTSKSGYNSPNNVLNSQRLTQNTYQNLVSLMSSGFVSKVVSMSRTYKIGYLVSIWAHPKVMSSSSVMTKAPHQKNVSRSLLFTEWEPDRWELTKFANPLSTGRKKALFSAEWCFPALFKTSFISFQEQASEELDWEWWTAFLASSRSQSDPWRLVFVGWYQTKDVFKTYRLYGRAINRIVAEIR